MASTKKRQTMGKITRERERREKRELKLQKKEDKKLNASLGIVDAADGVDNGDPVAPETPAL